MTSAESSGKKIKRMETIEGSLGEVVLIENLITIESEAIRIKLFC